MNELLGFSSAVAVGASVAAEVFLRPKRGFYANDVAQIQLPQVTIEEKHHDTLAITSHPVELGSNISDHSFMQPFEVTLKCGWSVSPTIGLTGLSFNFDINSIYDKLRSLQTNSVLLDIFTGKRQYKNMLIQDITVETDTETANALIATIHCKQIIIAQTSQITGAPTSSQANAPDTSSPVSGGQRNLKSGETMTSSNSTTFGG